MIFCEACNCQCEEVAVDFGVGPTQCGSHWQNDVSVSNVSNCCDAPTITPKQIKERRMQYIVNFNHPIYGKRSFLFDDIVKADDSLRLIWNRWPNSSPKIEIYGPVPEQSEEFRRIQKMRVDHFDIPLEEADFTCEVAV